VPLWVYHLSPLSMALVMVMTVEAASLVGLLLVRRFVVRHIRFHDGVNDAISGIVAVIGVFYGITVGLLAVGVWNTWATAWPGSWRSSFSRSGSTTSRSSSVSASRPTPTLTLQRLIEDSRRGP
jgi:hypothetical protein